MTESEAWIFTDEAHAWMDLDCSPPLYGGQMFTLKDDRDGGAATARWPEPDQKWKLADLRGDGR